MNSMWVVLMYEVGDADLLDRTNGDGDPLAIGPFATEEQAKAYATAANDNINGYVNSSTLFKAVEYVAPSYNELPWNENEPEDEETPEWRPLYEWKR